MENGRVSPRYSTEGGDIRIVVDAVFLQHMERYRWAIEQVRSKLPCKSGLNIVDAGCGSGYGSFLLSTALSASVVGVDINHETIQWAKAEWLTAKASVTSRGRLLFIQENLSEPHTPLSEWANQDMVVAFELLEHLHDPGGVLYDLWRMVKIDGLMLLSIPINHPDTIYHKVQFTEQQADTLVANALAGTGERTEKFNQYQGWPYIYPDNRRISSTVSQRLYLCRR